MEGLLNVFTSRELATVLWAIAFVIVLMSVKSLRKGIKNVIEVAINLWWPFFLMIVYAGTMTILFSRTIIWNNLYLKDIVIWVVFVGTPLYFGGISKKLEDNYFVEELKSNFKLTVFVEFILNIFTFPLFVELMLVPILAIIFLLDSISETKSEYRPARKVIQTLTVVISVIFIIETVFAAIHGISSLNLTDTLVSLFIPIVYSVLFIPASYMIAVISKYQVIFLRMKGKAVKDEKFVNILHRLKVIRVCLFSLSRLYKFERYSAGKLYENMGETKLNDTIIDFKRSLLKEKNESKAQCDTIAQMEKELKETVFRERLKYISEHSGIFTLLVTILIGVISTLIKGFVYVYNCGIFDYWGISHTYINLVRENFLYDFVLYAAGSILYIVVCHIPSWVIRSTQKCYMKILEIFILIIIPLISVFIFLYYNVGVGSYSLESIILAALILVVLLYIMPCFLFYIIAPEDTSEGKMSKSYWHKLFKPGVVIFAASFISVYFVLFYLCGRVTSYEKSSYKIIERNFVVLYETEEQYIVADCEITDDKIVVYSYIQRLVNKEGVITQTTYFNEVEKRDKRE